MGGRLAGWVVGNFDFYENPFVHLDLDFDLGFVIIGSLKKRIGKSYLAEQFRQIKRSVAELFRQIKRSVAEQFRHIKRSMAEQFRQIKRSMVEQF